MSALTYVETLEAIEAENITWRRGNGTSYRHWLTEYDYELVTKPVASLVKAGMASAETAGGYKLGQGPAGPVILTVKGDAVLLRARRLGDLVDARGYVQQDPTHRIPISYLDNDDVDALLAAVRVSPEGTE